MRAGFFLCQIKKNYPAVFLVLFFFILFRFDPIPFNTDDFGFFIYPKILFGEISGNQLALLKEFNLLSRAFAAPLYVPFYFVFGNNFSAGLPFFHLFLSLINLAVVFVNYKLFEKLYARHAALLSSFLLGTSFFFIYNGWYMASININIATLFLLLCAYFFSKAETKKAIVFAAIAVFCGIMTRETTIPAFFLMSIVFLLAKKEFRTKPLAYFLLGLPFVVFFVFSFLSFSTGSNGTAINPIQLGFLAQNMDIVGNLMVYFEYFNYYFLSTFFAFAIVSAVVSLLLFFVLKRKKKKNQKNSAKKKFQPKSLPGFFEKHCMTLVLLAWFFGSLVPLVAANQFSPRYIIPVLPPLFGLAAAMISKGFLNRLNQSMLKLFSAAIFLNLAFLVLFLNFGIVLNFLQSFFSISFLSKAFNALFYLIILTLFAGIAFFVFKCFSIKSVVKGIGLALLLLFVSLATIVQANEINVFFVTHYHNSDIAFKANEFLAKNAPNNAIVYNQQDLSWIWSGSLLAFHRQDIRHWLEVPALSSLKEGDFLVYQSRAGPGIGQLIQSDKNKFELLASFGGEYKKFPRSTMDKSQLLKNGTLFNFFLDAADTIEIYRVKS